MNNKTIKITVQNLKPIHSLCEELGIDSSTYDIVDNCLAGKLIFDLSRIKLFHLEDLRNNRIDPPNPLHYVKGGKYDKTAI